MHIHRAAARGLLQLLGCPDAFWLRVPSDLMFAAATLTEWVHAVVGPTVPFEPFLTRAEVCKVGHPAEDGLAKEKGDRMTGHTPLFAGGLHTLHGYGSRGRDTRLPPSSPGRDGCPTRSTSLGHGR
jgi:hypothetical protein